MFVEPESKPSTGSLAPRRGSGTSKASRARASPGAPAARNAAGQPAFAGMTSATNRPSVAPAGIASRYAAIARPRILRGKMLTSSVNATTVDTAPAAPAIARAAWIWSKDRVRPVATTARLHTAKPMASSRGRRIRSMKYPPDNPATAAPMSSTVASQTASVSSSLSSAFTLGRTEAISQTSATSSVCMAKKSARTNHAQGGTPDFSAFGRATSRRTVAAEDAEPVAVGSASGSGPVAGWGSGLGCSTMRALRRHVPAGPGDCRGSDATASPRAGPGPSPPPLPGSTR